ncbi:hypothetical protein [Dysgonomonas sp. 520]|uniref:hypothetical protein n=1 Tax=Dysgonomonas sp. 520 TaxID=2302931 RepID=UPI0013D86A3D|nr:hypothetical protein [Dysgonomonas sp. 520]NDW08049.1 hypothetical protein [Dysgonomonas sp. 520]
MKTSINTLITALIVILLVSFSSCKEENKEAQNLLSSATAAYENNDLAKAKQLIDSIESNHPRAINERKQAYILLQKVRKGENDVEIKRCDSLLSMLQPQLDEMKKQFAIQQNKKYQDKGMYVPKIDPSFSGNSTGLRSGVMEDGDLILESVYNGGGKHAIVIVNTKDGNFAETKEEYGDGLNYRLGGTEIIRYTPMMENGVAKFIFDNQDQVITVSLRGQHTASYVLSNTSKNSIVQSYKLATLMKDIEDAKTSKEKAILRNQYLEKGGQDESSQTLSDTH